MATNPKPQDYVLLSDEKDAMDDLYVAPHSSKLWYSKIGGSVVLMALFLISLISNTFLLIQCLHLSSKNGAVVERSAYAQLTRDTEVPWKSKSPYFGVDEAVADRLWEEISIDNGTVALDDSYVETTGLPLSQRFLWDQEKGIYLLNGFHSMHCLKTIRQAVLEFDRGLERSEPTEHILHCLDALRQDVLCYADDTPRYTGFQPSGHSGTGQVRRCRSWSQLEAWAQQHTACWRYIHPHDPTFDMLERHKFCPEGSPYAEMVKEVFG